MLALVSILVPVYNRESIIEETLRSALNQTYNNIEVVVVDNASTDRTWEAIQRVASKDTRVKAFRNETNLGPVRNWLRCVEEATGEYGKILWSDDLIAEDFLKKCLPLMNDETAFVYSGVKIFTNEPDKGTPCYFIGGTGHKPSSEYIKRALLDKNVPVSPGCAIFRMEDIRNNLLLNVENNIESDFSMHAIGNDLLLFLLTAKDYPYFGFVAEPLSFFRSHDGSITVSSNDGKIPLHYMLVKTFYSEKYQRDMLDRVATNAWLLLKRYPVHKKYGINQLDDFFKSKVKLNYFCVLAVFFKRIFSLLFRLIGKIFPNGAVLK
jgi:glycosyltransferase involved in cell wall biosynthesis